MQIYALSRAPCLLNLPERAARKLHLSVPFRWPSVVHPFDSRPPYTTQVQRARRRQTSPPPSVRGDRTRPFRPHGNPPYCTLYVFTCLLGGADRFLIISTDEGRQQGMLCYVHAIRYFLETFVKRRAREPASLHSRTHRERSIAPTHAALSIVPGWIRRLLARRCSLPRLPSRSISRAWATACPRATRAASAGPARSLVCRQPRRRARAAG